MTGSFGILGILQLVRESEEGIVIASPIPYFGILLAALIASYCLGSLNSAIIVSKALYRDDVRNYGSHNAGLTNMLRVYGKKAAVLTLIGDMLKVVLSVALIGILFGFRYAGLVSWNPLCYIGGLFCMIGHIKPVFYGFKGGKGVLVYATMGLILSPVPLLLMLIVFVLIVWMTKYISLGSIIAAALYPIALQATMQVIINGDGYDPVIILVAFVASLLLIFCHRANIRRLLDHTENKFSFHSRPTSETNGAGESDKK